MARIKTTKKKKFPLAVQERFLKKDFPASRTVIENSKLIWKGTFQPTPFSKEYKVRLEYVLGHRLEAFVIEPEKLPLYPGKRILPHVYDSERQLLCLYFKDEWTGTKILANTVVPWIAEWLYFYEIWFETGNWEGGGLHPPSKKSKRAAGWKKVARPETSTGIVGANPGNNGQENI